MICTAPFCEKKSPFWLGLCILKYLTSVSHLGETTIRNQNIALLDMAQTVVCSMLWIAIYKFSSSKSTMYYRPFYYSD